MPTSGASRMAPAASAPKPSERRRQATRERRRHAHGRRASARRTGHDDDAPGSRMARDVGLHVVQQPDVVRREHLVGRVRGQHAAVLQQHQRPAEARREVEVVRGHDDRRSARARCSSRSSAASSSWYAEIERGGRLVEQQDAVALRGRDLRQRRRDDHALLSHRR